MTKSPKVQYAPNGCPLKAAWRGAAMYPAPVYVATFADGTIGRHSFSNKAGAAIDFERGRAGAAWLWRDNTQPVVKRSFKGRWENVYLYNDKGEQWNYDRDYFAVSPRADLIAGHVEVGGETIADPFFMVTAEVVTLRPAKPHASALDKLLAEIAALEWSEVERLQAAIDERLAA